MPNQKRKRVVVSTSKKLEAIKRFNNGESLKKIALEFGVGETPVGDWRRNKAEIEAFCSKMDSSKASEGRSTLKKSKTKKLIKQSIFGSSNNARRAFLFPGTF